MHTNKLLIQGNLCGIYLQADNCTLSDPDNLEWNIASSSVSKPPITPFILPSVSIALNIR
jgi:sphingomyelin phosphodiesterase